jgi:hypothetical protein
MNEGLRRGGSVAFAAGPGNIIPSGSSVIFVEILIGLHELFIQPAIYR